MDSRKKHIDTSMILGKIPPQAKEVEMAVLGAIMLEREAYDTAAAILKPECFYLDAHKTIFKAMKMLVDKSEPIDSLTMFGQLIAMKELENIGGAYYLSKLTDSVTGANVDAHSRLIFQKYVARELISVTNELNSLAYDESQDIFELMSYAEKSIIDIGIKNIEGGMSHISKVVGDAASKIEEWMKNDDTITGIPCGFPGLDKATRGWQNGDLVILAARPSVGKTAFALNIIRNAAENEKGKNTIAVWSLEMKAMYLALRMMSAESKTFLYRLQTGRISQDEMDQLYRNSIKILSNLSIYFDESSSVTLQSLSRKARQLKKKQGLGLIVIDYLQLMSGEEKAGNREQEVAKISRGLKNLAQELDVPIIALSQLSREMGSKNITWEYGPPISAIRESGAIEQDADVIMMLWGPSDGDIANDSSLEGRRRVRIAKQRNGVLVTEELDFKNEIQVFEAFNAGGNFIPVSHPNNWQTNPDRNITTGDKLGPKDDLPF